MRIDRSKRATLASLAAVSALSVACGKGTYQSRLTTPALQATSALKGTLGGPENLVLRLAHDSDLNPQQELQLLGIRRSLLSQTSSVQQVISTAGPAVVAELAKATPDVDHLHQLANQMLAVHAEVSHSIADQMLALNATLSASQRQQLADHAAAGPMTKADLQNDLRAAAQVGIAHPGPRPAASTLNRTVASSVGHLRPDRFALRYIESLKTLTPQQNAQLHAAVAQIHTGQRQLDQLIEAESTAVAAELEKPSPDAATVHGLVDQAVAKFDSIALASVDQAIALRATLSDAQVAALTP